MISDKIAFAIVAAAHSAGIDPAGLLAVVEVEADGGRPFESDGRTPCFLYERHVAHREAKRRDCLPAFVAAGLAIPKWDKATQYRDQAKSAQRLDLMARASAIDKEVACRSASWGLGQTMGNLAERLGFASAVELVDHCGTVEGQIDCMVREIKSEHLVEALNQGDYAHFARIYNGAGYAANHYDTRLADAAKRAARRLDRMQSPPGNAAPELSEDEVRRVQERLRDLGYHGVGAVDGLIGSNTVGAISAFQAHEGLAVNGALDAPTRDALNAAAPRPVAAARAEATADDLREAGSTTVAHADSTSTIGTVVAAGGALGAAEKTGTLDRVKDLADQAGTLTSALDGLSGAFGWLASHWWLGALVAGGAVAYRSRKIIAARLADHRAGIHPGTQ